MAAQTLATERFEELVKTQGFMQMGEEALARLLDDDDLVIRNEEAVWEAMAVGGRVSTPGAWRWPVSLSSSLTAPRGR